MRCSYNLALVFCDPRVEGKSKEAELFLCKYITVKPYLIHVPSMFRYYFEIISFTEVNHKPSLYFTIKDVVGTTLLSDKFKLPSGRFSECAFGCLRVKP